MSTSEIVRADTVREPVIVLVDITTEHDTIHLTDSIDTVAVDGVIYQPWPLRITFSPAGPGRYPGAQIELSNVTQIPAVLLRQVSEPPSVRIRTMMIPAPEDIVTYSGEPVESDTDIVTHRWGTAVDSEIIDTADGYIIAVIDFRAEVAVCELSPRYDWTTEPYPPQWHDGRFLGLRR